MLDASRAVFEEVRVSVEAEGATLYSYRPPASAGFPRCWMYPGAEGQAPHPFETQPTLRLDVWAGDLSEAYRIAEAVDWLHEHHVPEFGDMLAGRYERQSRVPLWEPDARVFHIADTYLIRCGSRSYVERSVV